MAVVQGIREKVHLPIYDSIHVERGAQLIDVENSSTLKFFVDVQRKTKLETNLQSASLLPHYNTFEARAMRVVISDLPPEFPDDVDIEIEGEFPANADCTVTDGVLKTDLNRAMELLAEARDEDAGEAEVFVDGNGEEVETGGTALTLSVSDI